MTWRENVIYKTMAEHTAHLTLNNSQSKENRYKNKQTNNKSRKKLTLNNSSQSNEHKYKAKKPNDVKQQPINTNHKYKIKQTHTNKTPRKSCR